MKLFSERHRAFLRAAVVRFNSARTPAAVRNSGQHPTKHGAQSAAVLNATRYADAVIQALKPKVLPD